MIKACLRHGPYLAALLALGCVDPGDSSPTAPTPSESQVETPTPDGTEAPTATATPTATEGGSDTPTPDPDPTPVHGDEDGDGYGPAQDCDESDPLTHDGAPEICDGDDNDCDGSVDEGSRWYEDWDKDGYGEPDEWFYWDFCDVFFNEGTVADNSDCNDYDENINPDAQEICDGDGVDEDCDGKSNDDDPSMSSVGLTTFYADGDDDGYGADAGVKRCEADAGYVSVPGDCDDGDDAIHPEATEICNGVDDNCDGQSDEGIQWYADTDGDGYGDGDNALTQCPQPDGYVAQSGDCDDDDITAYPGADEVCSGSDNDCDGQSDEGLLTTWYADADDDGYGAEGAEGVESCEAPANHIDNARDCDDADGDIHPEANDAICDGVDDNCDGDADDEYIAESCGVGVCAEQAILSTCEDGVETACEAAEPQDDLDAICDGRDMDCDGAMDEDYVPLEVCGVGYCATESSPSYCDGGQEVSCEPGEPLSDADESCDEIDDDCDGYVDEDCPSKCSDLPTVAQAESLCNGPCPTAFKFDGGVDINFDVTGFALDGDKYWLTDFYGGRIYTADANSGDLTNLYGTAGDDPTGIEVLGDWIYSVDIVGNEFVRMSKATGEVAYFDHAPTDSLRDLAIYDGYIWGISRDNSRLYQMDIDTFDGLNNWDTGLDNAAAISFCHGFPLVTSRDEATIYLFDLESQSLVGAAPISGGDEPYALDCDGSQLFMSDSALNQIGPVDGVISGHQLNGDDQGAAASTLPVERDTCSPFELYEFGNQGQAGTLEIVLVAHQEPLVAAIFAEDNTLLYSAEIAAGAILELPGVAVSGQHPYYLEVGALERDSEADYGLWARLNPTDMKGVYGTVYGDGDALSEAHIFVGTDNFIAHSVSAVDGTYSLSIPVDATPDFILISAEHADFESGIEQVDTRTDTEVVDFYLSSEVSNTILVAGTEEVTHLGDDSYSGSLNSQFVKASEGIVKNHKLAVNAQQLEGQDVEVSILLKGAQYDNRLLINDEAVAALNQSPDDGSYGSYSYTVPATAFIEGENILTIESVTEPGDDDYDDFEYAYITVSF